MNFVGRPRWAELPEEERRQPEAIAVTYGPHLPPERAIRIALDWAEDQEIITEDDRKAALDWLYRQTAENSP